MGVRVKESMSPEMLKLIQDELGFKYYYVTNEDQDHCGFEGTKQECIDFCLKNKSQDPTMYVEAFVKL